MDDRFERYEIKLRRAFPLEESFLQQYEALPSSAKSVMVRKHVTDGYNLIRQRMSELGESYTYKDAIYSLCTELGLNEEDFLVYLNYYTPPNFYLVDLNVINQQKPNENGADDATPVLTGNGSHEREDFAQRDHNNLVKKPQKLVSESMAEQLATTVPNQSKGVVEPKQDATDPVEVKDSDSDINKEAKEKIKNVLNW